MAIVVEELARVGVHTLLRVGTSGPVAKGLRGGDVVITLAAARFEGTSASFAPMGFPATADPQVHAALVAAAEALGVRYRSGITATVDTFQLSQGRRGYRRLPIGAGVFGRAELADLGILNVEMEASVLLTLARLYGLRAGVLCAVYPRRPGGDPVPMGEATAIRVANEAAYRLVVEGGPKAVEHSGQVRYFREE